VSISRARDRTPIEPEPLKPARLRSSARRDALLDAAVELIAGGDIDDVSMDTVAERAGVSRPLVYKHFANRHELLSAVYRREAGAVHEELSAQVVAAGTVEEMFRTLVRGSMRVLAERAHLFAVLRSAGGRTREIRDQQRSRDRDTVKAFAARAARQYGLERREVTPATAVLLGAIDSVTAQWRLRPTQDNARHLEEVYMAMVTGAYAALRSDH
jgi:AcrR family transcriptional regulator